MNNTAYYSAMGLKRDATQDEIKRAYRKLARKYHPDVSKADNAEVQFKEMKEAYECLKDSESRAAYDQYGEQWKAALDAGIKPGAANHAHAGSPFGSRSGARSHGAGGVDFGDIFGGVFADQGDDRFHRGYRTQRSRGEDVQARMEISIEESFEGAAKHVQIRVTELGDDGRPRTVRRKLDVKVPKGIIAGQRIRLSGQGHAGMQGAKNGDLYVEIGFAAHAEFEARERDVFSTLLIAPWEAALGASVKVETLGGSVQTKISSATSSGKTLRLKGRGLPGKVPGDHYVELGIDMSGATSDDARGLYEQLRSLETTDSDPSE